MSECVPSVEPAASAAAAGPCGGSSSVDDMCSRLLALPAVRTADRHAVRRKIARLVQGGASRLQVISDFDYTISRYTDPSGQRCWTTHQVFDMEAGRLDPQLGERLLQLRDKYLPIEFDPHLTTEQKLPHMEQWWTTAHSLIASAGFTRPVIEMFVRDANVKLRDMAQDFLNMLNAAQVPLVLFSAGVGDVIDIFLRQTFGNDGWMDNLHVISNMMEFDEQGVVTGFKSPLIHTFNKNASVIDSERPFFEQLSGQPNVLLLGDSLGDLHMDVGVVAQGEVLKIGFLNFNEEALLPKYLSGYDLVLVSDQSMQVPYAIAAAALRNDHNVPYSEHKETTAEGGC